MLSPSCLLSWITYREPYQSFYLVNLRLIALIHEIFGDKMAEKLQHTQDIVVGIILRSRVYPPVHMATSKHKIWKYCEHANFSKNVFLSIFFNMDILRSQSNSFLNFIIQREKPPILKPDTLHNGTYLDAYFGGRRSIEKTLWSNSYIRISP